MQVNVHLIFELDLLQIRRVGSFLRMYVCLRKQRSNIKTNVIYTVKRSLYFEPLATHTHSIIIKLLRVITEHIQVCLVQLLQPSPLNRAELIEVVPRPVPRVIHVVRGQFLVRRFRQFQVFLVKDESEVVREGLCLAHQVVIQVAVTAS